MLCTKRRTDADKNEKTCLAKVEKTLEILSLGVPWFLRWHFSLTSWCSCRSVLPKSHHVAFLSQFECPLDRERERERERKRQAEDRRSWQIQRRCHHKQGSFGCSRCSTIQDTYITYSFSFRMWPSDSFWAFVSLVAESWAGAEHDADRTTEQGASNPGRDQSGERHLSSSRCSPRIMHQSGRVRTW